MRRTYKQLTVEDRRAIGACLGRSPATISRELRRNSVPTKVWKHGYVPLRAQALTERRRQRDRQLHPAAVQKYAAERRRS